MNSYIFVNNVEICKFKAKNLEINVVLLCLGNVSKKISINNRKKTGLFVMSLIFQHDSIGVHILGISKYLMKRHDIK